MTLKEKLDELQDNDYINIGTKSGSGWIYICTKKDLVDGLEKLNKHYREDTVEKLRLEGEKVNTLPDEMKKQEETIETIITKLKAAIQRLEMMKNQYISARDRRDHLKVYLEAWVNMADRDVLEFYPLINRPDGTAIVISGEEFGKFWTLEEVKRYESEATVPADIEDDESEEAEEDAEDPPAVVPKKKKIKPSVDDEEVLRQFNQGVDPIAIAQKMGVNPRTIRNHLKDMGAIK